VARGLYEAARARWRLGLPMAAPVVVIGGVFSLTVMRIRAERRVGR
jgi:hypothetical protein